MKKFEKVMLAAFILLIVCLSITTCMVTPKAKVTKTSTNGKTTLKTSPIKNAEAVYRKFCKICSPSLSLLF